MFRLLLLVLVSATTLRGAELDRGPWAEAAERKPPMTVEETKAFMRRLVGYVEENHVKRAEGAAQRGMVYEYFRPKLKGQPGQWMEGEALDTMHDGAWLTVALASANRATADPECRRLLREERLPFYLRMLNHSDELFSSAQNDALPEKRETWAGAKEWLLQGREKGFVPYWWDDGASLSLEMVRRHAQKNAAEGLEFPGTNLLAGQANPEGHLSGYSHGSSNHLAQDLGVMLQQTWLLFHRDAGEAQVAREIAEAARHLQECRARHGSPNIPAVLAAAGLANQDAGLLSKIPAESWKVANHFTRAVVTFQPGKPESVPAFADDQEYRYYSQLARGHGMTEELAWKTIFDALTLPQLYRLYSDDAPVPPGIGVFDLHPYKFADGHPEDLRSQRKGPSKRPRPIGSRFGPQNMVCCGWAIQALRAYPGVWEKGVAGFGEKALGLEALDRANPALPPGFWRTSAGVEAWLVRELSGGLRTWEAIFDQYGYIPTGLGTGSLLPGMTSDELSDAGGYAHLLSAGAQWILVLEGKRDWER